MSRRSTAGMEEGSPQRTQRGTEDVGLVIHPLCASVFHCALTLEVLDQAVLQAAEHPVAEQADAGGHGGGDEQAAGAGPPAVDEGTAAVADDAADRIGPDDPAPFLRYHQVEVDDRRQPEAD